VNAIPSQNLKKADPIPGRRTPITNHRQAPTQAEIQTAEVNGYSRLSGLVDNPLLVFEDEDYRPGVCRLIRGSWIVRFLE
jgi:hypothetical protein